MSDLTILIPARNEMFLSRTIEDIIENMRGDTSIIAVCDGGWPDPPVEDYKQLSLIYHSEPIGQRAATNEAARLSDSKYVMKCDAHCAFDEGFDVKMIADMQDDYTLVPKMYNLHAFDWVCKKCEHRRYQGKTPVDCPNCDNTEHFERDMIWKPRGYKNRKPSPESTAMRFDKDLKFQYWSEYKGKQNGDVVETMSLLGACWMCTREKYFDLEMLDESHGSWGQMGTEVACKTWLSGGKLMVTKNTWFAHMFRTQGGDFGFPYPNKTVGQARDYSRKLWIENKWDKAKYPLEWLIKKFNPIPDWHDDEKIGGIVYYTDNRLDDDIFYAVQRQLHNVNRGEEIISVSLKKLHRFGRNTVLDLEPSYLTMFKQILAGLERSSSDYIFFCEHDVLYHHSHFDFVPSEKDKFYYNTNVWKVRYEDGLAVKVDFCQQTSGLCAYRGLLIEHYRKRIEIVERDGFSNKMGFEPGTHNRDARVDDYKAESWQSEHPNIDIRHSGNLTPNRWSPDEFRNEKYAEGWTESHRVPGWGITKGRFNEFLTGV
jgi:glycosyltransferase involved in cell wall biosynthesis